jgi:PadR family transcriptional regulator, regulatory protein PadR
MPRRRKGAVLPLEVAILSAGLDLQHREGSFYGFLLAKEMTDGEAHSPLVAHGTLYKALSRMTDLGLLEASWEAPEAAEAEGRPRRRLYRVSAEGERVLAEERRRARATATTPARIRHA